MDILLYDTKRNTMENITEHDIKENVFNAGTKGFILYRMKEESSKESNIMILKRKKLTGF
jgi:hypothetical protein